MNMNHYYLVSAKVKFRNTETDGIGEFEINSTIVSDTNTVGVFQISRAQQTSQAMFINKFPDPNIVIFDVFISAISYLGKQTKEEWEAMPAGMSVQEIDLTEKPTAENDVASGD